MFYELFGYVNLICLYYILLFPILKLDFLSLLNELIRLFFCNNNNLSYYFLMLINFEY